MATKKPSRAIKLFGTEASDGKRRELAAGPITVMFDNGALRYIRYRGVEVLRGIAYLLRDKNWGTYGPESLAQAVAAVPMSLLADHPNVQFNYFRGGLGTCDVTMH